MHPRLKISTKSKHIEFTNKKFAIYIFKIFGGIKNLSYLCIAFKVA